MDSKRVLSKKPKPRFIFQKDGCYYHKHSSSEVQISNFIMKVIFFIQSQTNPLRVVEVANNQGQRIQFDMPADSMTSLDSFCKALEGKGNYIFSGSKASLFLLKEMLFKEERNATDLPYLGFIKRYGIYAFSNGIFDSSGGFHVPDDNGMVKFNSELFYLHLSNPSTVSGDYIDFQPQRLFAHNSGTISFEGWAKAFVDTYGFRGMIGICFLLSSINRDVIFDRLHFMPILFLVGKPQSGKSTFRRGIMRFFGEEQKPLQCGMGSTQKALSRKLGQFSNAVISCEEYKNTIDPRLIETFKGIYDGEGYERAKKTNDNQTHATSVMSSLILTGQQLPTKESALFSRCNLLEFNKSEYTKDEAETYEKLISIQEQGLTHLTGQLLKYHDLIRTNFNLIFTRLADIFRKKFAGKIIADRTINNYCALLTPYLILQNNKIFDFSFNSFDLIEETVSILNEQLDHLNATTEINQFWQIFKLLMEDDKALRSNTHYQIKVKEGRSCIFIRFEMVADQYREYCLKRKLELLDNRTLSSYLKNDKAFMRGNHNGGCHYITVGGQKKSCFCFEISLIGINLIDE